jgi:D-3-phosphoglycerate dehydrogenase
MRILLAEQSSFSQKGIAALNEIAPVDVRDLTQAGLVASVPGYDILVVRLGLRVDRQVLAAGKGLKIVGTPTTGLDHIDLQAAQNMGVSVLSLKGERQFLDQVFATAEHSFGLLQALIRRIPAAFEAVKDYQWRRDVYRGRELAGKRLGIVGCGRLGSMMVHYGQAFGMHVLTYDPYVNELPPDVERCASLEELLTSSDAVSIHVPLNAETQGMFSQEEFAVLREGAVLVNTARGALIDEAALVAALESGRLAGAAVDVLRNEHRIGRPGFKHPLIEYARTHENLIITPHIGGATQESVEKADLFLANKILRFLEEEATNARR